MATKDKRLQIRVTESELAGIQKRAKAAGLSVADYGRKLMLAGDNPEMPEQETMISFEGESTNATAAEFEEESGKLSPEQEAEHSAQVRTILAENGAPVPDWTTTTSGHEETPEDEALDERLEAIAEKYGVECTVTDVPAGVRCIKCGNLH